MKKETIITLFVPMLLLIGLAYPDGVTAEVDIHVGITVPSPPPYRIAAPPPVVVIPGTYVYYAAEADVDIFFFGGHWYRPHHGRWYRSGNYNGPWHHIGSRSVPVTLVHLPPDYRRLRVGHKHIPHGHLQKNWKKWEREKHWEKHGGRDWHGEKWEHKEARGRDRDRDRDRGKGRHRD